MVNSAALVRKGIKLATLPAGLLAQRRTGDSVVLIYHRLGDTGREVDVSVHAFDEQLALLAEHDHGVSIEAVETGAGGIAVTFDDGYRDFYDSAVPKLVHHGVPATLYLQTGLIANGTKGHDERLTWSMLREAVSTGLVTIGAHTHTHPNLSAASAQEAEGEMKRSKESIEEQLQMPCRHFAYPFGSASEGAVLAARGLFATAALGNWRTNRRGRTDLHRLGRTPVLRSDGALFFRAKVAGRLQGEAAAYRALGRGPWKD
jgi:peptidoglycan/xylan/chitin deacetylase (PgdA/CDA1 family)